MLQQVERIVLVQRYTTIVGTAPLYTKPRDIRRYASAALVAWAGEGNGTDPTLTIQVQESMDLTIWRNVGALFTPDGGEWPGTRTFTQAWLRLRLLLTGTNPAITCWMTGDFVVRGR